MLDVISGGRLVAGFPVGTPMDTNFCYGQIPALTRDKYHEAHDMIMKAWAEDEPFAFDGKYNQLRWVNCWPKPIQKPHPPIYIPGGGSIETWDFCLDHDYNYSYLSFYGYLRGKSLLDGYWERVAKRGKDDSPYRAAFAQIICVADTDAEAEELYAEHCLYFFNRCLHVLPAASPTRRATAPSTTIKYGALSQLRAEAQKLIPRTSPGSSSSTSASSSRAARRRCASSSRSASRACGSATSSACSTPATCRTGRRATPPSSSPRRSCRTCATCGPSGSTTTAGGSTRWTTGSVRRSGSPGAEKPGRTWRAMKARDDRDARRARAAACSRAGSGAPLVFLHGAGGLLADNPFLDAARARATTSSRPSCRATASPPARSCSRTCSTSRCTAGTWSTRSGSTRPHLVGHSMGGMIAAEMACLAPARRRASSCWSRAAGLWIDEHPIPDLFALLPVQLAELLFHDPARGQALLTGGADFSDMDGAQGRSTSATQRRLAMAGKILFPIPNRRVSKRLYRLDRDDPGPLGRQRQADPARLRRALGPPDPGRDASTIDPGRRPHAALRAAGRLRRRRRRLPRLTPQPRRGLHRDPRRGQARRPRHTGGRPPLDLARAPLAAEPPRQRPHRPRARRARPSPYAHNSLECLLAPAAARAAGAVAVPMNHRLVADEVAYILDHSDASPCSSATPSCRVIEEVRERAATGAPLGPHRRGSGGPWARRWPTSSRPRPPDDPPTDPSQGLGGSMIYTGGTTGRPEGRLSAAPPTRTSRLAFMHALGMDPRGHVHLVAGPALPFRARLLRGVRGDARRHRGGHEAVRSRARPGPDRPPPVHEHVHGADPGQAHPRPARGGARALRRVARCARSWSPPPRARCG